MGFIVSAILWECLFLPIYAVTLELFMRTFTMRRYKYYVIAVIAMAVNTVALVLLAKAT